MDYDIRETTCLTSPLKDSRKGSRPIPQGHVYTPRTQYNRHPNRNREVDVVVEFYFVVAEAQRYSMVCVEYSSLILLRSIGPKTVSIPPKQWAHRSGRKNKWTVQPSPRCCDSSRQRKGKPSSQVSVSWLSLRGLSGGNLRGPDSSHSLLSFRIPSIRSE